MAEGEREKERLGLQQTDPKLYYDWESRFIKARLERRRLAELPRVIKPPMFSRGGNVLGDVRVYDRYAVGPVSSMSGEFVDVAAGQRTEAQRCVPGIVAYVVEGGGTCLQEDQIVSFEADDVVAIPPYTRYQFVAGGTRTRLWIPKTRIWHALGLLWQEKFEFRDVPEGMEALRDPAGEVVGYRIEQGVLGLPEAIEVTATANPRFDRGFRLRRSAGDSGDQQQTRYDWFLARNAQEVDEERRWPRLVRGAEQPWENTRQGRIKFYVSHWTPVAARDLDLMLYEIEPHGFTGEHRHIPEEMLLVLSGSGHDVQDGISHPWEAGDIVCVPMLARHQHFNDGDTPARLVSVWPTERTHEFLGGIEQLSPSSVAGRPTA